MATTHGPVRVEDIDWRSAFPFVNLFRCFRLAIHPPRLLICLALVILHFLYGGLLDQAFGPRVHPGDIKAGVGEADGVVRVQAELERIMASMPVTYRPGADDGLATRLVHAVRVIEKEHEDERAALEAAGDETGDGSVELARLWLVRQRRLGQVAALQPRGVFQAALEFKVDALRRMATALMPASGAADEADAAPHPCFFEAAGDLCWRLPCWLACRHPGWLLLWMLGSGVLWAWLGGTAGRMVAVAATLQQALPVGSAMTFAKRKFVWLLLAPLVPIIGIGLVWLAMAVVGLVFNVYALDIVGAILFPLALAGGFVVVLLLVGLAGGGALLIPAICVEGSEAFDALTRVYNYALRPWRLLLYYGVAIVHGAATLAFVSLIVLGTIVVTRAFAGTFVFTSASNAPVDLFHAMVPPIGWDALDDRVDWSALGFTSTVAASIIRFWILLLLAVPGAYAVSYALSACTWIYLLLRRVADGTDFEDVFDEGVPPGEVFGTPAPEGAPAASEGASETSAGEA
ncbi:MAG: hypothetical protein CMJ18_09445 [Phycisphaeraceae bacterium]|nr:hypothetical protein [Phycisphaeraceae bacterium]